MDNKPAHCLGYYAAPLARPSRTRAVMLVSPYIAPACMLVSAYYQFTNAPYWCTTIAACMLVSAY
jgi:hypothetical protein